MYLITKHKNLKFLRHWLNNLSYVVLSVPYKICFANLRFHLVCVVHATVADGDGVQVLGGCEQRIEWTTQS